MADDIYDLALGDDFNSHDIENRITELQEMSPEDREEQAAERARYDMLSLEDELAKLEDFKAQVYRMRLGYTVDFISDRGWDNYAADCADDAYGEATRTAYWDRDRFADDLRMDYTVVELLDYEFYFKA
jgi:hypothetical protein